MMIHLPADLESSIQAAVHDGRFASVDDAMAAAARYLLRTIRSEPVTPVPDAATLPPLIGSMRDAADELDEIVADAYRRRREGPWRTSPGE
jgi:Arc/MetJ-type ribon-helix-helix transcriptional regulator